MGMVTSLGIGWKYKLDAFLVDFDIFRWNTQLLLYR